MPTQTANGEALITAIPKQDPSSPAAGRAIDRLRAKLPPALCSVAPSRRTTTCTLSARTPLVIGAVLGLGFLLLVFGCRRH